MDRLRIQRLSASRMNPKLYRELADHGEELITERKEDIPEPERLAAEVASMANMLGGWILLGVEDQTRILRPLELKPGLDLQSHIGNLLRNTLDPIPPFLAETLNVDGVRVGFIRVFQASVPVLVTGAGAVYTRDAGGKVPISSHRELLELARSGQLAEDQARNRPDEIELSRYTLAVPPTEYTLHTDHIRTIVRAAPFTVTPQITEWPITDGPSGCWQAAEWLARKLGAPDGFSTEIEP